MTAHQHYEWCSLHRGTYSQKAIKLPQFFVYLSRLFNTVDNTFIQKKHSFNNSADVHFPEDISGKQNTNSSSNPGCWPTHAKRTIRASFIENFQNIFSTPRKFQSNFESNSTFISFLNTKSTWNICLSISLFLSFFMKIFLLFNFIFLIIFK